MKLDARAKIKVTEFDWRISPIVHAKNILWLKIPMSYSLRVEKCKGRGNIFDDKSRLLLIKTLPFFDMIQQLPATHLLKYKVELVTLLKILNKLNDVRVALN